MINDTTAGRWFRRVMWLGILANLALALPTIAAPDMMIELTRLPTATPVLWPRFAGLLLVILSVFYTPAGTDSRLCSTVRRRTDRSEMSSTTPTRFEMQHVSPTASALSLRRKTPPRRFSTVFCAPNATATPPMPTPASAVLVSTPKIVRIAKIAATVMSTLPARSARSVNDRLPV